MGDYTDGYGNRQAITKIFCKKCQRSIEEGSYNAYHREHDK